MGSELRVVEQVLGRSSPRQRAIKTIGIGMWFGLLVGVLFAIFVDTSAAMVSLTLAGLAYGAAFGALVSVLVLVAVRGDRRISTRSAIAPSRYVLGVPTIAGEARRVLEECRPER